LHAIQRQALAALAILVTAAAAAQGPLPGARPLSSVDRLEFPRLDNEYLRGQAIELDEGGPYHFAEPIEVGLTPDIGGSWETLEDGRRLWRVRLASPGAVSLNLGFDRYRMPPGGSLRVFDPDGRVSSGPFTDAQNEDHGELWTPALPAQELVVEVVLPAKPEFPLELSLWTVNHGYRSLGEAFEKSGACNVDVVCPEADGWRDQVRSVAVYSLGGALICTGALVNNTANDGKPYFLTANHCGITSGNASSMVIYWNYENSTCRTPGSPSSGQPGDGSFSQSTSGAYLRAAWAPSDMTLVELDDEIPTDFNPYWSGWDRRGGVFPSAVAIHHPQADEKRISFENNQTSVTSYLSATSPGDGTHVRVADWDLGTTEPGSSGSPLYSPDKRIVGQLHGGYAACGNNEPDWYGLLAVSWSGGGSSSTRLSNWLDPLGLGVQYLDGYDGSSLGTGGEPVIDDSSGGDGDGTLEPGETGVQVWLPIRNSSGSVVTGIQGTMTSPLSTVTVTTGSSNYADLAVGATGSNLAAFIIDVSPMHPCGDPALIGLDLNSSAGLTTLGYAIPTGPDCDFIPAFAAGGEAVFDDSGGNGSGAPDPGEGSILVYLPITNSGASSTGVVGTLSSPTPGVQVVRATAPYGSIAKSQTKVNDEPFEIALDGSMECGGEFALELALTSAEGDGEAAFAGRTGLSLGVMTVREGDLPRVEFDLTPPYSPSVTIPVQVGAKGAVLDVNVSVDVLHTFTEDVVIELTSPDGGASLLFDRRGGAGIDIRNTTFDDEAATGIATGWSPFTGSYRPEAPLSVFDGIEAEGEWLLTFTDTAELDWGIVNSVALEIQYAPYLCGGSASFVAGGDPGLEDGVGNGNGNGAAEPGETTIEVFLPVRNMGGAASPGTGTLTSPDPLVQVLLGEAPYPAIASASTRMNDEPFLIALDPSRPCLDPIPLILEVTTPEGAGVMSFEAAAGWTSLQTVVKTVTPNLSFGPTNAVVTIPVVAPGEVIRSTITLNILHTWVSDLEMLLTSPDGGPALLFKNTGGSGRDFINTILADGSFTSISSASAPFTGTFRPVTPLARLAGDGANGTWTLEVRDTYPSADNGVVQNVTLTVDYAAPDCEEARTVDCVVTDAATGGALPNGSGVVDFGTISEGQMAERWIEIANPGDGDLLVWGLETPEGFTGFPPNPIIPPGASDGILLRVLPATKSGYTGPGTYAGTVRFRTGAPGAFEYEFQATVEVTPNSAVPGWREYPG